MGLRKAFSRCALAGVGAVRRAVEEGRHGGSRHFGGTAQMARRSFGVGMVVGPREGLTVWERGSGARFGDLSFVLGAVCSIRGCSYALIWPLLDSELPTQVLRYGPRQVQLLRDDAQGQVEVLPKKLARHKHGRTVAAHFRLARLSSRIHRNMVPRTERTKVVDPPCDEEWWGLIQGGMTSHGRMAWHSSCVRILRLAAVR
eukprot:2591998-Rhodomonas_salina.2